MINQAILYRPGVKLSGIQAKYAQPSIGMIYSYFRDTQCHTGLQYVIEYYIKCLVVPIICVI